MVLYNMALEEEERRGKMGKRQVGVKGEGDLWHEATYKWEKQIGSSGCCHKNHQKRNGLHFQRLCYVLIDRVVS